MKRYVRWIIAGVVLLVLAALVVWTFSQETAMTPRASEAWSRGRIIGQTPLKRHVALQPAPDGGVYLIWQNLEERLELVHIGVDGKVLLERVLPVGAQKARDPQLQVGADGRLNLLWREGEHPRSTVHYVLLEADGTPVSQPQVLSDPASPVLDAPRLILDAEGQRHAIWADEAGIQWAALSAEGILLDAPTLLAPEGRFPAARADSRGWLHLAWQRLEIAAAQPVYYVALDPESGVVDEPEEIAQVFLRTGQRLGEPAIGLTPETGYVLWWVQDFRSIYSWSEYASFPLEFPQQRQVEELQLRRGENPAGVYTLEKLRTPLLMALSESVPDPDGTDVPRSQVAVIVLGQDEAEEQVVSASTQASMKPVLTVDDRSHMHLAWLETAEFGQYRVVYASTAPEVMENYNALTLWDILDAVFSKVFQLSIVVVAAWAAFIVWAIFPLLGLLAYHLVTGEETLDTVRSRVALGTALAVEVALTFRMPPLIGVEVAWSVLRWGVPAVTATVTTVVMVSVLRRRVDRHLFGAFFLFTVVNSVLQVILYLLFQG